MIYAFGHQKYCGKDSSARFLETQLKTLFPRLVVRKKSFAASLKSSCAQLYGWAGLRDGVYYENHPELKDVALAGLPDLTPRKIWIAYGNSVRDGVHPDTFVMNVLAGYDQAQVLLITDLRYPNEGDRIHNLGGLCILTTRPGLPIPTDVADTALNGYSKWDYHLENHGTLHDLEAAVQKMLKATFNVG